MGGGAYGDQRDVKVVGEERICMTIQRTGLSFVQFNDLIKGPCG